MKALLLILSCLVTSSLHAFVHAKIECFVDVELSKEKFTVECPRLSGNKSILGFHLLAGETYYFAYYRSVQPFKECLQLKKEYMGLLKDRTTVRLVIDHPDESDMLGINKKSWPLPFSKKTKMISGPFLRLQGGNQCKAYFPEHCELPERYWGECSFF